MIRCFGFFLLRLHDDLDEGSQQWREMLLALNRLCKQIGLDSSRPNFYSPPVVWLSFISRLLSYNSKSTLKQLDWRKKSGQVTTTNQNLRPIFCRPDFFLLSSCITIYFLSDDTNSTAKREKYDWMAKKIFTGCRGVDTRPFPIQTLWLLDPIA